MFEVWSAVLAAGSAISQLEAERQYEEWFMALIREQPADQQAEALRAHRDAKEKARLEAIQERRHQELCRAIRSVRPIGFGFFV